MTEVSTLSAVISLSSFLMASGLLIRGFRQGSKARLWIRFGFFVFFVGTVSLGDLLIRENSASNQLAMAIALATGISWFIWKTDLIAAFTAPVVSIVLLAKIFFTDNSNITPYTDMGLLMKIHVTTAILGQTFAVLACGMSLLFLWLDRKLKGRKLSELPDQFPAFSTLTKALSLTLWSGFIFITLSLILGASFSISKLIPNQTNIYPKVAWAILVWAWYLAILVLNGVLGYSPQKVARLSIIGFLFMTVSWCALLYFVPWRL